MFFAIVAKEIIEKKLCQKITYKYRKNRKNNKSNKNQDLEKEEAKKGPEMSANIAKVAKVTRIFLAILASCMLMEERSIHRLILQYFATVSNYK